MTRLGILLVLSLLGAAAFSAEAPKRKVANSELRIKEVSSDTKIQEIRSSQSVSMKVKNCLTQNVILIEKNYDFEAASDLQDNLIGLNFEEDGGLKTRFFALGNTAQGTSIKAGAKGLQVTKRHMACPPPSRGASMTIETYEISNEQICAEPAKVAELTLRQVSSRTTGKCP